MSKTEKYSGHGQCATHGQYQFDGHRVGSIIVGASCPACLQSRHLEAQTQLDADSRHGEIAKKRQALSQSGVPNTFLDSTFENYICDEASKKNLNYIRAYAKGFKLALAKRPSTGMVLLGISGTGKTHLACALIRQLHEDGYTARYVRIPDLLIKLNEATYGRAELPPSRIIDALSRHQLLVLDEYGAHTLKDESYQALFSVIEARYQKNLPTVLITNLTESELQLELDARFLERILGNTSGVMLSFNWGTYRMKKN
jgi:DNA replication protein DnaC